MQRDCVDWLMMGLGLIGAVADGFSTPLTLFITSKFMNSLGTSSVISMEIFVHSINMSAVAFVYLACGKFVACLLEGYCWTRTAERQAARMRAKYLKAVLRQDIGYFDLHVTSSTDVVTSISGDILVIQDVLSDKLPNFLVKASIFLGSCTLSVVLLWRLAVVSLPFLVVLPIPSLVLGRALMGMAMKMRLEYNKAGEIAEQAISSIRTVYAFVGETKTISEFSMALEGSVKVGLRQGLTKGLAIGSNGMVYAIWAFTSWYGSRLVMYHGAQGGTIFAVVASLTVGGRSLGDALYNLKYFTEAHVAATRMAEVSKRVPEIDSYNTRGRVLNNISGEFEFRHVKFAYPSRPESIIFEDFCLKVPARKTMALVGASGSGKSSIISLLQRFYDPISGDVLLDGVAINELQLKWLRSQIGVVSQEPALFATSIKENLLFGKEDATMEEIVEACKASNAHNFICQLPQGYDTQVGERGIQMSGGQKQRIAIARAIIKSPRILLLDESTSALDSESEQIVQKALENVSLGRTTIIIAHRLSTVRNADTIVVLQDGRVMETGSHEDLIENEDGPYASLVKLQRMDTENPLEDAKTIGTSLTAISGSPSHSSMSNVDKKETVDRRLSQSDSTDGSIQTEQQNLPRPTFKRLLTMNLPEWKQALMGCIGAAIYGAVTPVFAFTQGSMVSLYFSTSHQEIKEKTRIYTLCFVGLAVVCLLVNIVQHYNFAYMGEHLTKRIRERMLSKILTFEVGWFDRDENSSGVVCSCLAKEANTVRHLVGDRMSLLVQAMSTVIVASTMGMIIAWRLAIVMIAVQPLVVASLYFHKVLLKDTSKRATMAQDESSKLASVAVSNIRTITAFSSQDRILKMLERAQEGPRSENVRQSWVAGIVLAISSSLGSCIWALDFWYCGKLISQGHITAGAVFEAFMILVTTGWVVAEAGSMTTDLAKGLDSVKYVFGILDRTTAINPHDPEGYQPERIVGHIEFRDVDFSFPARPDVVIFKGFSIDIEAGKSTAIVGPSGSGKSTIISLIERFYDPNMGVIEIDGKDLRSYHLSSLRKHIALVNQEPTLFAGTVRENIVYGLSGKVDESEIIEAAKAANAHDFIASLKNGYDTWCGDRGVLLSGGQKQRIAIARAILKNPKVLLLDEATSALDSRSERLVQDALERVMMGRTSVIVAHRLSTIQNADLIAVLDKGKVVEKGTHEHLLAKGSTGAYYSLARLQLQRITIEASED